MTSHRSGPLEPLLLQMCLSLASSTDGIGFELVGPSIEILNQMASYIPKAKARQKRDRIDLNSLNEARSF